jgi:hypothetical protein
MGTSTQRASSGAVQRFSTPTDDAERGAPECAAMSPTTHAAAVGFPCVLRGRVPSEHLATFRELTDMNSS